MARMARLVLSGHPHHIVQRGVRSGAVFFSDKDREYYLSMLKEQGKRHGVSFIGYCLMTNHVHLIAIPESEESLAQGIGTAHRYYTRMINFRQKTRGYLFQGRFYSCPMDESHFLAAMRYVERNPVRAGTVRSAWQYRWSSASYHVGRCKKDMLVKRHALVERGDAWKEYLRSEAEEIDFLRQRTRTGRPCGDEQYIRLAERQSGRELMPKKPGPKGSNDK